MKKVIICNVPMRENVDSVVFTSDDQSLPVSDRSFKYPINAFLTKTLTNKDELKVILLIKKDKNDYYLKNTKDCKKEFLDTCIYTGATVDFTIIDTDFDQNKEIHEKLMGRLVDEIVEGSHIMADITYGPKDLPIIIFSALSFAEKFLRCEVDNIVYGKADFKADKVVHSQICDMVPLYYLSSVTNTIKCDDPERARAMLKSLLEL